MSNMGQTERINVTRRASAATAIAQGIAAIAAVVLAIIGLAGGYPFYMLSIACISAGAALFLEGAAVGSRYAAAAENAAMDTAETAEVGGGIAADTLAGLAGIILGVLALIGIAPLTLVSAAAITFGAALAFGSAGLAAMNERRSVDAAGNHRRVAQDAVYVSAGGQVLAGIGAAVLGILAVLGFAPLTLNLVALLVVGGSALLSGGAIGFKSMSGMRHHAR